MRRPAFSRCLVGIFLALVFLAGPIRAEETKPIYTLQADGLACPFCAYGIEKHLGAIAGVGSVETDIKSGTITIIVRDGAGLDEDTARKAVAAAGFTMRGFELQRAGE